MNTDMKKQTAVMHIRNWIRINGEMSKDEESITYSCASLDKLIREAKAMEKEQIVDAYNAARNDHHQMYYAEEYYNETYGGDK